jgi:hypothetical protein
MIRILWATDLGVEKDWETDYWRSIFDKMGVPYQIETVTRMDQIVPNAIIIINHSIQYMQYLMQYERSNTPFGVIHLSDEWFNDDHRFYDFKMCKFAFRNYYHEQFEKYSKLKFVALGYKYGFWENAKDIKPNQITYNQRPYIWSFAGAPRTDDRRDTLKLFTQLFPYHIHYEQGNSFGSSTTGLSTVMYRQLLLDSQFGLCPKGISNTLSGDTFRVTETLECGGIPVVIAGRNSRGETYWKSLYGVDPPFVIGDTWEECLVQVRELRKNASKCEEQRLACFEFWQNYKQRIAKEIINLLS